MIYASNHIGSPIFHNIVTTPSFSHARIRKRFPMMHPKASLLNLQVRLEYIIAPMPLPPDHLLTNLSRSAIGGATIHCRACWCHFGFFEVPSTCRIGVEIKHGDCPMLG